MKTFLKIGFLALVLLSSQNLFAQEDVQENENLLHYYDMELFQWSYDFWGGLNLNYQNQSSTTMYGLKDSMQKAFSLYDDTNQKYLSYRKKTTFGNVFFWTGFAAIMASPFIIAYGPWDGEEIKPVTLGTSLGVMGGGLISLIVGTFFYIAGQEEIFDAVNLYNRNRIKDHVSWR